MRDARTTKSGSRKLGTKTPVALCDRRLKLYVALSTVAIGTKHLTVFGDCLAALTPRGYMVGLHFFNFKMPATFRAGALLTLICSTRHFWTEYTNA